MPCYFNSGYFVLIIFFVILGIPAVRQIYYMLLPPSCLDLQIVLDLFLTSGAITTNLSFCLQTCLMRGLSQTDFGQLTRVKPSVFSSAAVNAPTLPLNVPVEERSQNYHSSHFLSSQTWFGCLSRFLRGRRQSGFCHHSTVWPTRNLQRYVYQTPIYTSLTLSIVVLNLLFRRPARTISIRPSKYSTSRNSLVTSPSQNMDI